MAGALVPLLGVYRVALYSPDTRTVVLAAVATACILPLQTWLILAAIRGNESRRGWWALVALAAAILVLMPMIGTDWMNAIYPVGTLVLLLVPRPWSVAFFVAVLAAAPIIGILQDKSEWAWYYALGVFMYGTAVAVPIWLTSAVRQLRATRMALADYSVIRERIRIDDELRERLGPALAQISARGERASAQLALDPTGTTVEVSSLVQDSRDTLGQTRRLARSYRQTSLRRELAAMVEMLAAAGIESSTVLPAEPYPDVIDASQQAALHARIVRLLGDESVRSCLCVVTQVGGAVVVDLRAEHDAGIR